MDKKLQALIKRAIAFGVIKPRTLKASDDHIYTELLTKLETLNTDR